MTDLVSGDYVKHGVSLAMDLLILGIARLPTDDENHQERVFMRSTLILLEMLSRNLNNQMGCEEAQSA